MARKWHKEKKHQADTFSEPACQTCSSAQLISIRTCSTEQDGTNKNMLRYTFIIAVRHKHPTTFPTSTIYIWGKKKRKNRNPPKLSFMMLNVPHKPLQYIYIISMTNIVTYFMVWLYIRATYDQVKSCNRVSSLKKIHHHMGLKVLSRYTEAYTDDEFL